MITRVGLRKVFENKKVVTKGYVMQQLDYKKYDSIKPFFKGLESVPGTNGRKFITEDVIDNMLELREFID